ncbi:MAG TPA: hypothetical protein VKC35_05115 [Vicinamibacterales bacterium]|nr:hypothetical protein [Vicinamibacterales bacterium]
MSCPLCLVRKERRACPALRQTICPVCCGTKRLTEIQCPEDCVYLASAREHPAAIVRRQQEHDIDILMPTLQGLTERQHQLFFLFQSLIARHTPEGFARLLDDDVAEAAAAIASTLETAARGVIYEHAARSLPAQRLATEMTTMLAEMREKGVKVFDREAALVLRAIEKGARETRKAEPGETSYLTLMARLLQRNREGAPSPPSEPRSLIIP